jgi:hypothetical protein
MILMYCNNSVSSLFDGYPSCSVLLEIHSIADVTMVGMHFHNQS